MLLCGNRHHPWKLQSRFMRYSRVIDGQAAGSSVTWFRWMCLSLSFTLIPRSENSKLFMFILNNKMLVTPTKYCTFFPILWYLLHPQLKGMFRKIMLKIGKNIGNKNLFIRFNEKFTKDMLTVSINSSPSHWDILKYIFSRLRHLYSSDLNPTRHYHFKSRIEKTFNITIWQP